MDRFHSPPSIDDKLLFQLLQLAESEKEDHSSLFPYFAELRLAGLVTWEQDRAFLTMYGVDTLEHFRLFPPD